VLYFIKKIKIKLWGGKQIINRDLWNFLEAKKIKMISIKKDKQETLAHQPKTVGPKTTFFDNSFCHPMFICGPYNFTKIPLPVI
jgi:hypothetical protein